MLQFTFGDKRFSMTSIQLGQNDIGALTERFRAATAAAGRPVPISMDEFTLDSRQDHGWIPVSNAERWRTEKLWPTYLSGGNIEFILGERLKTDSFKSPELAKLWDYVWYARSLVERLPFWEMKPADDLVSGAAAITVTRTAAETNTRSARRCLPSQGAVYAVYFPIATATGQIDLSAATTPLTLRWYNPPTASFKARPKRYHPIAPSHSAFRRQMSTRIGSR